MTDNRLDIFLESLHTSLRCRKRRRWIICMFWLAIPALWERSGTTARDRQRINAIHRLPMREMLNHLVPLIEELWVEKAARLAAVGVGHA